RLRAPLPGSVSAEPAHVGRRAASSHQGGGGRVLRRDAAGLGGGELLPWRGARGGEPGRAGRDASGGTVRAAFCRAVGKLVVEEVPRPTPGPGEVVVRVRNCGICGSDLHWYHDQMMIPSVCPGHEIAGEVAEVGAGVTALRPGDPVALEGIASCGGCRYCLAGDYQRCLAIGFVGLTIP